jgi:hypothetical protein
MDYHKGASAKETPPHEVNVDAGYAGSAIQLAKKILVK